MRRIVSAKSSGGFKSTFTIIVTLAKRPNLGVIRCIFNASKVRQCWTSDTDSNCSHPVKKLQTCLALPFIVSDQPYPWTFTGQRVCRALTLLRCRWGTSRSPETWVRGSSVCSACCFCPVESPKRGEILGETVPACELAFIVLQPGQGSPSWGKRGVGRGLCSGCAR